ncbi:hypothetical protein INT44_007551 [Umbelopsis vinacea]|uniref:MOSC domain-containing protein n=1 Tax=Umbelopsis vinacea TaxID=44442 RepID=A0A8H7UCQ1_9FUNG|nr:hypothetical protein INT44_007551 [Umbelopsis vinacea]
MPHLEAIAIHPIKSCHRIDLTECEVGSLGLEGDRRFMVVNADNMKLVTQRAYASMSLIRPLLDAEKDTLTLTAEKLDDLVLPLHPDTSKLNCLTVTLWSDKLQAFDVGDAAAEWLEKFFSIYESPDQSNANGNTDEAAQRPTNTRLVTLDLSKGYERKAHPELPGLHSPFTDWSPVSFGFEGSLKALNDNLVDGKWSNGNRIPMNRFRNNLTIAGTEPWEEDTWLVARVGEVTFYLMQPTARCPVPGINQDTGVKDTWGTPGPMKYLLQNRQFDEMPGGGCFCCDSIPLTSGTIRVGDKVEVLERIPAKFAKQPKVIADDRDEDDD